MSLPAYWYHECPALANQCTRLNSNAQCSRCLMLPPTANMQPEYGAVTMPPSPHTPVSYGTTYSPVSSQYPVAYPSYPPTPTIPSQFTFATSYPTYGESPVGPMHHSPGATLYPQTPASASLSPSPQPTTMLAPQYPGSSPPAGRGNVPRRTSTSRLTERHECGRCGSVLNRPADLDRHKRTVHGILMQADGTELHVSDTESRIHFCTEPGCERMQGGDKGGFTRKDHLTQHLRQVHGKQIDKKRGQDRSNRGDGGEGSRHARPVGQGQ